MFWIQIFTFCLLPTLFPTKIHGFNQIHFRRELSEKNQWFYSNPFFNADHQKKFIKSFSRANSYTGSWILKEYTSRAYSHKGIKDFILQLFLEQILRKGSRILPPGTRLCKQCSTSLQSLFKVNIIFYHF